MQADQSLQHTVQVVRKERITFENDLGELAWRVDCGLDIANFVDGRISWLDEQWKE